MKQVKSPFFFIFICCFVAPFLLRAQNPYNDSLTRLIATTTVDSIRILTMVQLADETRNTDLGKAVEMAKNAKKLSDEKGFKRGSGRATFLLGLIDMAKGDFDEAGKKYSDSKKLFEEINDKASVAQMIYNLGVVQIYKGNYAAANNNFFSALKTYEELGIKKSISDCYIAVANTYGRLGNDKMELLYHKKSLVIKEQLNDKYGLSACYINIGNVYGRKLSFDTALTYYFKGLEIAKEINNKTWILTSYGNIGTVLTQQGKTKEGLDYLLKAIDIAKEIGDKQSICGGYNLISNNYLAAKEYTKAKEYAEKALQAAKEIGSKSEIKSSYENLSQISNEMGDYKEAYAYHKLYSDLKDSLINEESTKQINEMQAKYDSDKKEQQITLLSKDKEIQTANLKQQEIITWSVVAGLLVVLVLAFFILNQYRQKQKANIALESAYHEIEEKNKDITASINYAKRIQSAILPSIESIQQLLPESFVLYLPKDIVSGDFYWFTEKNNRLIIAVADCTGHGVPGAFMSMIGNDFLTQIVIEKNIVQPNLILTQLHEGVKNALKQDSTAHETKDGMDIAIVSIDKNDHTQIRFAGALRPLWIVKQNLELIEYKGDKHSIGGAYSADQRDFTNHSIELEKGDVFYLSSDGYADQFGGENGKKFMTRNMKELLRSIHSQPMRRQEKELKTALDNWKQSREQIDDVLVVGVKI